VCTIMYSKQSSLPSLIRISIRAQQSVLFPQVNLGHFVLEFVMSLKYAGTRIVARDSHSNRLTSEDTEYNVSVY